MGHGTVATKLQRSRDKVQQGHRTAQWRIAEKQHALKGPCSGNIRTSQPQTSMWCFRSGVGTLAEHRHQLRAPRMQESHPAQHRQKLIVVPAATEGEGTPDAQRRTQSDGPGRCRLLDLHDLP